MNSTPTSPVECTADSGTFTVEKRPHTRNWNVNDPTGQLVAVTVYKRGASEVARLLNARNVLASARP